jgi:serine protease AprX
MRNSIWPENNYRQQMKYVIIFFLFFSFFISAHSQNPRYIVFLKHKGATNFAISNPGAYLSQRAIDRRTRYSIAIDSADLPVPDNYISQIRAVTNVTVLNISKWLNAITIQASDANAITAINALPFVKSTSSIALRTTPMGNKLIVENIQDMPASAGKPQGLQADFFNYGTNSFNEIHLHKGEFLHNIGLRGQGMQIAILDGGFLNYTTLDAMDSIIANGQVLSTWDFVNREPSVVEDDPHGMQCLSTIAANIPGSFVGKAPKASFHLYRTEDVTEYPIETFNWVCGAEKADSIGADIISSSLGYTTFDNPSFDFTYNDMNGNTTLCTKGADIAAKKGLLEFIAVGNYGTAPWKFLAAPADADSVLAVGAVSSAGAIWPSTSYGPSADGRIKPDVASIGSAALIQNASNTIGSGFGTSFSCPNMAGLGTCLWQGFPEFTNMRIVRALREAGSIVSTPNDRIGYGIPDMKAAFGKLLTEYATSSATDNACIVSVQWNTKDVSAMRFEIERKAPGETNYSKIADINAQAGLILANHHYQFDNTLTSSLTGTYSYRVKQVIDTAAASLTAVYIDTADVAVTASCTPTATVDIDLANKAVFISPNPVSGNRLRVIVQTQNSIPELLLSLYDLKGQLISQYRESKGQGKVIMELPLPQLANGKYLLKVNNRQKSIGVASFIKL